MAFINENGQSVSYECSDLIEELRQDIAECGSRTLVYAICKKSNGVTLYVDYELHRGDVELQEGEWVRRMYAGTLLSLFEEENKMF